MITKLMHLSRIGEVLTTYFSNLPPSSVNTLFMKQEKTPVLFWFRRDLRLHDNKALRLALDSGCPVLPLFIFDENIIDSLPVNDHRLGFIYDSLASMNSVLQKHGSSLLIRRGKPLDVMHSLLVDYPVKAVYCNADHEPYGRERDAEIASFCRRKGLAFHSALDHLVMGRDEVLKSDGSPYHVFTPYSRKWLSVLSDEHLRPHPSEDLLENGLYPAREVFPELESLNLRRSSLRPPLLRVDKSIIDPYDRQRDYPALDATTRLGVHLRFGTLSIRSLVAKARQWNEVFLNELIWREFYAMILWHYPKVVTHAFKPTYDRIDWRNDEADFARWKEGCTGYPMVDAGMRQLAATGYMHNRLRMITASFLSKHLLIDWRWGEAWFARLLFDYELSSNNGGWQWSAGTGCDAAPYFRIFNPASQQKKFDPKAAYIRKWIPELDSMQYPAPIVDHPAARERCLKVYREALNS